MEDIVTLAKERAEKFGVKDVVVATISGATAKLAKEIFGQDYQIFAVGNPTSAHERGLVIHVGISEKTRKELEEQGIKVILQNQSLGQAVGIGGEDFQVGGKSFDIWGHYFQHASLQEVIEKAAPTGEFNAVAILFNTLNLFGDGPRVCFEVALMAADSGILPLNADCIAIARPWPQSNCPHAAIVLRPCRTEDIFNHILRVKDLVLVPGPKDHWFDNGPLWVG